jgi:hypothetical protein
MLHTFGALCLLVIAAAIILPTEIKVPAAQTPQLRLRESGSAEA